MYLAQQAILDPKYPGHNIGKSVWFYLKPPAGLIVSSKSTRGCEIAGIPRGMLLQQPRSAKIPTAKLPRLPSGHPNPEGPPLRRPCAAAFACTDF